MRRLLAHAWGIYRQLAAVALAVLAVVLGVSLWLDADFSRRAGAVLVPPPPERPSESGAERAQLEERVREFEESRRKREAELQRLELVARSSLVRAEAERAAAEAKLREAQALTAAAKAPAEREFESNVDLLSRMDPSKAGALMSGWDDATVAKYLRAMRAARAAELVEAMQADPAWKDRLPKILQP